MPAFALSALLFLLTLAGVLVAPSTAHADSGLDGKWVQGPLKETYTILKWQKECEAPPVDGASGGGESIRISTDGDELSFVGGGRVFKTNQCYDQMPTLARESHTRNPSGREWRTRCSTPPSDPRHAVMNTLVAATTATHIDIIETGRYESQLAGGLCTADVKRSRSFDLVAADSPTTVTPPPPTVTPKATPTPPPAPVDPGRCSSPGEPSRLEARPSRKLLRAGEAFAFRANVLDANGCGTRTATTWAVDGDAKGITVDASGNVTVAADAPEGSFDVVVTAAGKSARVTVQVTSASRYDALLQQSGLNDAGETDVASVAMIASAQMGGGDARGEDGSSTRRAIFIGVIALLAVALGVVALVAMRRTKKATAMEREAQERHAEKVQAAEARKREKVAQHAAAMRAHEESVEQAKRATESAATSAAAAASAFMCPTCRQEFGEGTTFCPNDATRLVPVNASPIAVPAPGGGICPTCKRGYDAGVKICPHDKDELMPYALYASRQPPGATNPAPRGKICPTCGSRYEGIVEFCGKDGTALVLLN